MLAVIGVGAIGGICAAELGAAGLSWTGCVRRPFETLVLEAPDRSLRVPAALATDPAQVRPVDWVLLATKAHQIEDVAPWLDAWVGPSTRLAVLQNGVEHVERVAPRWLDPERVVPVVVACPATAVAPGHIVQRRPARLFVRDDGPGRDFAALFDDTAVDVVVRDDWSTAAWRKLCLNVTSGALAALAGVPLAEVTHPRKQAIALALALECAAVGRAEGADLPDAWAREIAAALANAKEGHPSTLTDRLAGRPLEFDARNGAVPRIGARHGIAAPVNARAAELLATVHRDTERDFLPELAAVLP